MTREIRQRRALQWSQYESSRPWSNFAATALRRTAAFTLIELILVMALLTIVISITAPSLSRFFHGRSLDSEARRLLALTRSGQTRAVTEGIPVDLWVDAPERSFGLQAEPSYETTDPKAVEFTLGGGLEIEVASQETASAAATMSRNQTPSVASVRKVTKVHPELPAIRFLPDGSISESSPQKLLLRGREGAVLYLAQATDRLSYEIRSSDQ